MFQLRPIALGALVGAVACAGLPRDAGAAAYFSEAAWYGALSDAAEAQGAVVMSPLDNHAVRYTDWYGTWDKDSKTTPFKPGPEIGPYVPPDGMVSRASVYFVPDVVPGRFAGNFSCLAGYNACVGVLSVTFLLPYEIIGFSGMLDISADHWPATNIMPELGVGALLAGTAWKNGRPDSFYGRMFDQPTDSFTVSWNIGGFGSDNFVGFTVSDVMLVRPPTAVPEPAAAALFGVGLAGLLAMGRRRRG